MQTRYHCDRKLRTLPNFYIWPLTAVHESLWFAGPWRSVRLLHRKSNYIFRFSIPIATFWYKHCFGANTVPLWSAAPNFPIFPFSVIYGFAWIRLVSRHVTASAFIAPTRRLHFWALHTHSYLLIWTLLWCKHGTIVIESFELYQITIFGPIRRCMKSGDLVDRDAQCVYCTEKAITFLFSPYP